MQTVSAQIPWSHNVAILEKVKDPQQRIWYIEKTAEIGWSHNVLIHQIESSLYERQVLADKVTNFEHRLPSPQSELAVQTMKDPYVFDFIPFRENMLERDIEQALVRDVTKLLLELGTGFAFLGNQYPLNVGGDVFYIDLLFYNLNLRCYVVIELKSGDFKPEYAGQLNFYLSAVDGILKKEQDNHHDANNKKQKKRLSGGVPFHAGSPAKLSCFHSVPLLRVLQYSRSGYGWHVRYCQSVPSRLRR